MFCSCSDIVSSLRSHPMFRSRRARPVWGVALSRVSDQSTNRRPLTVGLFPADLQATLGIFTGNARKGAIDAEHRRRAAAAGQGVARSSSHEWLHTEHRAH